MNQTLKGLVFEGNSRWVGARAIYESPFENQPHVACWRVVDRDVPDNTLTWMPVLDDSDLERLSQAWTTAGIRILEDFSLDLIHPADAGRRVQIRPVLFEDDRGELRMGWPIIGYILRRPWRLIELINPEPTTVDSSVQQQEATVPSLQEHNEPERMLNGPVHLSGTFRVHLSDDEVNDLMNDSVEGTRLDFVDGKITRTSFITVSELVDLAVEKVSPKFAQFVEDSASANVSQDPDGFAVEFHYNLDL